MGSPVVGRSTSSPVEALTLKRALVLFLDSKLYTIPAVKLSGSTALRKVRDMALEGGRLEFQLIPTLYSLLTNLGHSSSTFDRTTLTIALALRGGVPPSLPTTTNVQVGHCS